MTSVRVSTSIQAHNNLNEPKELRLMVDVSDRNRVELADAVKQQHEQAQGPVIQWDRFLPVRSLKVLLVEDDDSTRHVVSALLSNCSYEVTSVANGLEAWKVLTDLNKQIDLVLTEVVMPHISGIGLLSRIMNLVPRKNIPVIMMSSDDSMGIVFNCLSKGAVDFLVKPIRKNELKNLWQHVWRKCHSSSGSESESGVGAHQPTKARSIEISDDESDESDEDDDKNIGLTARDGSGTQSSLSKRVVEVEPTKYLWDQLAGSPDSTCVQFVHARPYTIPTREHAGEYNQLDTIAMGKDLEICTPRYSEKIIESNLKGTSGPRTKSTDNVMIAKTNDSLNSKCSPALELSLKRPLDVEDADISSHKRNVFIRSDSSAFSRYNNTSHANHASTTNIASCSPLAATITSEATNAMNVQSNSNGAPNQHSNASSTLDNDMGSSTNNNQDDESSRNMVSNGLTAQAETNYGSASGSNSSKSNVENENSGDNGCIEKGKFGNLSGSGVDQVDQDRLARREAALNKFRQKRKERCFVKKVRYQSRKKLAEQRPRVRGQFVRQGGKDADS